MLAPILYQVLLFHQTFLHAFGSTDEISFLQQFEEYLVKVVSPTTKCTTFDDLRFENYTSKKASLINLLPTSNSIKNHLYCCFFIIQELTRIYNKPEHHNAKDCAKLERTEQKKAVIVVADFFLSYVYVMRCAIWSQSLSGTCMIV